MASRIASGRGAKAKGSNFERELAAYLKEQIGINARRALLSGGGSSDGGADLDGTPMIHVEAKRTETFAPYAAMQQAETAINKKRGEKPVPVVMQRRNNMKTGESLVVMRLDHWLEFYRSHLSSRGATMDTQSKAGFESML